MEERKQVRVHCRQTIKLQYENVQSHLNDPTFYEKSTKEELKLQREMLQNYLIVEEKKAWRVVKLKREREKEERRQLFLQQLELSDLHSTRRLLDHFGLIPWKKLMISTRLLEERAFLHSAISLLRKTLFSWKSLMSSREREVFMYKKLLRLRADYFRNRWQQGKCWSAWLVLHRAEKLHQQAMLRLCFCTLIENCSFGWDVYDGRLLRKTWFDWVQHVNVAKGSKLMKALESERIATRHAQRTLQKNILRSWLEAAARSRMEKQKITRHAEAWCKIQSWLDELNQFQSQVSDVIHSCQHTSSRKGNRIATTVVSRIVELVSEISMKV